MRQAERVVAVLSVLLGIANEEHSKKMEEQGLTVRYMDPARMEKYWAEMEEQIKPLMNIAKEK
jgi:hypothetical protein